MAAGFLDPSFDGDGRVTRGANSGTTGAVVVQGDGKVVVAGFISGPGGSDFFLARYNGNGTPDASFGGGDGVVTTDFGTTAGGAATADLGRAVMLQRDGKIVVAGASARQMALARYLTDGTLDNTFSGDGITTTSFGGPASTALDLAVDSDNRIVVAGGASPAVAESVFALARFLPNGNLDTDFGTGGRVTTADGLAAAYAVAVAPGGKIVAAGHADTGLGDGAIVRYDEDGSLDEGFGSGGVVHAAFGAVNAYDEINDVAVEGNGAIVVAGQIAGEGWVVSRFAENGRSHARFTPVDFAGTGDPDGDQSVAASLAVQPDGKIVAAGYTVDGDGGPENFAVVRYHAGGAADNSFGLGGVAVTDFDLTPPPDVGAGTADAATGVALSPDGSVVVAGSTDDRSAVARYLGDRSTTPAPARLLPGRALHVSGTAAADAVVFFHPVGNRHIVASLDGQLFMASRQQAPRLRIETFGGADYVAPAAGPTFGPFLAGVEVYGGDGADFLVGGHGNDTLSGGGGNDALDGRFGSDVLFGGDGNDSLAASEQGAGSPGAPALGNDVYSGGGGIDTLDYSARTAGLFVQLGSYVSGPGREYDRVRGDVENVVGGSGNDRIYGTDAQNVLIGGGGDDLLVGRAGNDTLMGEAGNDTLLDATGTNDLIGGAGTDTINGVREGGTDIFLEAENAAVVGAQVGDGNAGYTGTGYVDFVHSTGDSIEWTVNADAGTHTLTIRYANGSSSDRPLELRVNGAVVVPRLSFGPTGGWSTWRTVTVQVTLAAGQNRIRLSSVGSNGANIDSLNVRATA